MTPVYRPFYNSVRENGRVVVNYQLEKDENNYYTIDFDRLESQIDKRTKMIMMCNPHNPAGACGLARSFLSWRTSRSATT